MGRQLWNYDWVTAGEELMYPRDFRNVEELCTAAEDISLTRDFTGEGEATDPEFVLAAWEKLLSTRFEHREELISADERRSTLLSVRIQLDQRDLTHLQKAKGNLIR